MTNINSASIIINDTLLGSEWTDADDIDAFAEALSEVTGRPVTVQTTMDECDCSDDDFNAALDLYMAER